MDALTRLWLVLYRSEYLSRLENLIRCRTSARKGGPFTAIFNRLSAARKDIDDVREGGGRTRAKLVASPIGSARRMSGKLQSRRSQFYAQASIG